VPENLPKIKIDNGGTDRDASEREWENRATILAQRNEQALHRSASITPSPSGENIDPFDKHAASQSLQKHKNSEGVVSSKAIDDNIQDAIRLHEEGQLELSTQMFGRLADPNGANNPLSQVLYGLALRLVF
jgi:aminopeptidase N